ncbi:unnamed protein product [Effrenium voratum]|nr:unnamed protein product [Effrenium voratum]
MHRAEPEQLGRCLDGALIDAIGRAGSGLGGQRGLAARVCRGDAKAAIVPQMVWRLPFHDPRMPKLGRCRRMMLAVREALRMTGEGVESWVDGSSYSGQYQDGLKHGKGTFIWVDGSKYMGYFEMNDIHGEGTYIWADGRKYTGQWRSNRMEGKGAFLWPDGRSYTGEYLHDLKHGFGHFKWPDNREYVGEWRNGKQHGTGKYTEANGVSGECQWVNGQRVRWLESQPA